MNPYIPPDKTLLTKGLSFTPQAKSENGLFVGLRLDGRVRSSGQGMPPWARFAAELAPLSGEGAGTSIV